MLPQSPSLNHDELKHAYIVAILKALVIFTLPFVAITFYFNVVQEYRPIPLFTLSAIFALYVICFFARNRFQARELALFISMLTLVVANINCYANQSVGHAGIAVLISTFCIAVVPNIWLHSGFVIATAASLFLSFNLAFDFDYPMGAARWLFVTFFGQLVILSGLRLLFASVEEMFENEHQLLVKSEAASREKSRFLANMSHEIRTPIAGVTGLLDTIEQDNLTEQQQDKLRLAKQSSNLLASIVNDILDYSKIEAGKLAINAVDFDLNACVEEAVSVIHPRLKERDNQITVHTSWEGAVWVSGDKTRLQQIMLNLLSNAHKFTEQGLITVNAVLSDATGPLSLEFSVEDSGIGMSENQLQELFRPFHQLDNSATKKAQGTGLGLLICKQILRLMDGDITVHSIANVGSTFRFSVPLESASPPVETPPQQEVQVDGLSVLIVEDNFINQMVLQEILTSLNVTSQIAEHGQEALDTLTEAAPQSFDVVLMDCQMPVMDGFQATQSIREGCAGAQWQDVPIVALTANALAGDREACLNAGMTDYLTKPVDKDALQAVLCQYLPKA